MSTLIPFLAWLGLFAFSLAMYMAIAICLARLSGGRARRADAAAQKRAYVQVAARGCRRKPAGLSGDYARLHRWTWFSVGVNIDDGAIDYLGNPALTK
ncbi:hypothetical protein GCM10009682_37850 [Luedemannella flava]|uniref:ATP synthase F0 subunit 8 n=1 Tax=Luedemannella flava TaxID=349316 RepID=A0ABP4YLA6_9ACTN